MVPGSFFYQPSTFVGRQEEQHHILQQLREPDCRLLTLVGPGGIGQTRLALEMIQLIQDTFAQGIFFVSLQPLQTVDLLIPTLAEAVGVPLSGPQAPKTQLFNYLQDKEMLLVLDNFEHLRAAAPLLSDLLQAAPRIHLLVTSRQSLNLQEEWLYRVPGLPVPRDAQVDDLESYGAVQLFAARARRIRPDFNLRDERAGVVRICQLVEGIPLAIELASTWLKTLRCAAIAAEIQRSIDFLSTNLRNVPGRHRSMRAVFNHSWKLMSAEEREVFRQLSVFRGPIRRAAAADVAGATLPILSGLVDKSLIVRRETGGYEIHELLRQFGAEKLNQDPAATERARERHGNYYAHFLQERLPALNGPRQLQASAEIAAEWENVLAAWEWAVTTANTAAIGKSAGAFFFFCQMQSRFLEGAKALAEAAAVLQQLPSAKQRDITLANVFNHEGWLRLRVGHFEKAQTVFERSRELLARHNEPPPPYMGGDSTVGLGLIYTIKGQHSRAVALGEDARQTATANDDVLNLSFAHYLLTTAKAAQGHYEAAYQHAQRACSLARQASVRWFLAYPLNEWGKVAQAMGKIGEAKKHFQAGYKLKQEFDDREGMAVALRHLGEIAILQSNYNKAGKRFRESLTIYRRLNDQGGLAASLKGLAQVAYEQQSNEEARQSLEQALAIAAEIQFLPLILALFVDAAKLLLQSSDPSFGLALLALVREHTAADEATKAQAERQLTRWQEKGHEPPISQALASGAELELQSAITTLHTILANPLTPQTAGSGAKQPLVEPLTDRERQVLGLMAAGYTNPEIAEELIIALGTVKWYASQIYGKLDVSNRTEAVVRAGELDLLS